MRWFIFILLLLPTQQSYSQSLLRLQHLTTDDGLSQNSVNTVFQSSLGFIWLATGDGLNRYDGKDFIVYKSSLNDSSLTRPPDRNVNSIILEDKTGRLWMASDAGIFYWDKRRAKSEVITKNVVTGFMCLLGIDEDFLWSAVARIGIYAVNIHTKELTFYPFTDKLQKDTLSTIPVYNGALTAEGLWVADAGGLLFFDKKTHKDKRVLNSEEINAVYKLNDGQLLLCAATGVYFFNPHTGEAKHIPIAKTGNGPLGWRAFAQNKNTNEIYIGSNTNGNICKLDPQSGKYEFLDFQSSIINTLFIDRSENLWIGTEGNGVFKLDIKQPKFFCYQPTASGSENKNMLMVKSIYRDDSEKIWMGTHSQGLIVYDPNTKKQKNILLPFPVKTISVTSVFKDSSGNIVVTGGENVVWLHATTHKVIKQLKLPLVKVASSEPPTIYAMVEWKKDSYIAATNLGLFLVNIKNGTASAKYLDYFRSSDLGSWTYNICKASNGEIYQARRNGFSRIKIAADTLLSIIDNGFMNVAVRHFYRSTHAPILWIATEQGLIAYNEATKKYKVFDENGGLANSYVYAILPENDSSLWISTNLGISHVQVNYNNGITIHATNYSSKDGLQSNEFNTGAFHKCADGTLIFGGLSGINWFQPQTIKPNPHKAIPALGAIFVNDTLFASDTANYIHKIQLPFSRNTISLSLRALEFTRTGQNMFAYKLAGVDKDWVYTSNDKARYPNLQPGAYTFLLKVSNNEGVWNDEPLWMQIIIEPPYWQRWWFRSLVVLSMISSILLLIRYYVKRKVMIKTIELEKQQALYLERLRISKDVHDDLGSGLSKISLMAEMAQTHINNGDAENEIRHISTVSKDLIDNMRDLIWVLNPENTTLDNLVVRIREYSADYLDGTNISAIFDFPGQIPELAITQEAQRNIFSTVKEAINNCIKHAQASKISVTLKLDNAQLAITVQDNGKGINPDNSRQNGNGLRNMRQRIEMVGGTFFISSNDGQGTAINILLPFEKIYSGVKNTTNV